MNFTKEGLATIGLVSFVAASCTTTGSRVKTNLASSPGAEGTAIADTAISASFPAEFGFDKPQGTFQVVQLNSTTTFDMEFYEYVQFIVSHGNSTTTVKITDEHLAACSVMGQPTVSGNTQFINVKLDPTPADDGENSCIVEISTPAGLATIKLVHTHEFFPSDRMGCAILALGPNGALPGATQRHTFPPQTGKHSFVFDKLEMEGVPFVFEMDVEVVTRRAHTGVQLLDARFSFVDPVSLNLVKTNFFVREGGGTVFGFPHIVGGGAAPLYIDLTMEIPMAKGFTVGTKPVVRLGFVCEGTQNS